MLGFRPTPRAIELANSPDFKQKLYEMLKRAQGSAARELLRRIQEEGAVKNRLQTKDLLTQYNDILLLMECLEYTLGRNLKLDLSIREYGVYCATLLHLFEELRATVPAVPNQNRGINEHAFTYAE